MLESVYKFIVSVQIHRGDNAETIGKFAKQWNR